MISEIQYNFCVKEIEKIHSSDNTLVNEDSGPISSELLYSNRMLSILEMLEPNSDYSTKLAAQCQHLKRWEIKRTEYPMTRQGYHQWRRVVMNHQLAQCKEVLIQSNIETDDIEEILSILRNQGNKMESKSQVIQDTACLVFVKWYLETFAVKHESSKVADILKKTKRKMSQKAIDFIPQLHLSENVNHILELSI